MHSKQFVLAKSWESPENPLTNGLMEIITFNRKGACIYGINSKKRKKTCRCLYLYRSGRAEKTEMGNIQHQSWGEEKKISGRSRAWQRNFYPAQYNNGGRFLKGVCWSLWRKEMGPFDLCQQYGADQQLYQSADWKPCCPGHQQKDCG